LEYMVATINNFGGFYSTELYVHEARMHGGIIEPPCINISYTQAVIRGKTIYLVFMFLQSMESRVIDKIIEERKKYDAFKNSDELIERMLIALEQIAMLIIRNASRFTGIQKRELLEETHIKVSEDIIQGPTVTLLKT